MDHHTFDNIAFGRFAYYMHYRWFYQEYSYRKNLSSTKCLRRNLEFSGCRRIQSRTDRVNHINKLSIGWRSTNGNTELSFLFSSRVDGDVDRIHFLYNYETKTLFGDTEFSYLLENFLVDYFQWCENSTDFSSNYSVESLGDIPFQYINPIWKRELSG